MSEMRELLTDEELWALMPWTTAKGFTSTIEASLLERLCIQAKLANHRASPAQDEVERLRAALVKLRRRHDECDDSWYSCPKSEEGCADENKKGCNCGADHYNAIIDEALSPTPPARKEKGK